jgi:hypothetical protein
LHARSHGRRSLSRLLVASLAALALGASLAPANAHAAPRRPRDGRWVGGLVLGIAGTAGTLVTLDVLLLTHTCFASGGCAPGESPSSKSSAWPYVGVATGFAAVGVVGWYLFATPTEPAASTSAASTSAASTSAASTSAARRELGAPSTPVAGFGVLPVPGGARAAVYFAF